MNKPPKPTLSPEFAQLAVDSKLELVLCGGQKVGHSVAKYKWILRDIYEYAREEEKTRILQKMAQLATDNFKLKQELNKLKEIKEQWT